MKGTILKFYTSRQEVQFVSCTPYLFNPNLVGVYVCCWGGGFKSWRDEQMEKEKAKKIKREMKKKKEEKSQDLQNEILFGTSINVIQGKSLTRGRWRDPHH